MSGIAVDNAKYRRLRANGVEHRQAVAMAALTPSADFASGGIGSIPDTLATDDEVAAAIATLASTVATDAELAAAVATLNTSLGSKAQSLTTVATKTGAYTATVGDLVPVSTAGGAVAIALPSAPANGSRVAVKHTVQGSNNAVTINCGGTDHFNTTSGATSLTLPLLNQAIQLQYDTGVWLVVADDLPLSQLDSRFLVRSTTVAYAATVTPNVDTTDVLNIGALTGNLTIAAPTGTPRDGQTLMLRFAQDATGGRTITYNAAFAFGTDVTAALDPSAASAKWVRLFAWNASDSKWRALAIARGF